VRLRCGAELKILTHANPGTVIEGYPVDLATRSGVGELIAAAEIGITS